MPPTNAAVNPERATVTFPGMNVQCYNYVWSSCLIKYLRFLSPVTPQQSTSVPEVAQNNQEVAENIRPRFALKTVPNCKKLGTIKRRKIRCRG